MLVVWAVKRRVFGSLHDESTATPVHVRQVRLDVSLTVRSKITTMNRT